MGKASLPEQLKANPNTGHAVVFDQFYSETIEFGALWSNPPNDGTFRIYAIQKPIATPNLHLGLGLACSINCND